VKLYGAYILYLEMSSALDSVELIQVVRQNPHIDSALKEVL